MNPIIPEESETIETESRNDNNSSNGVIRRDTKLLNSGIRHEPSAIRHKPLATSQPHRSEGRWETFTVKVGDKEETLTLHRLALQNLEIGKFMKHFPSAHSELSRLYKERYDSDYIFYISRYPDY